jgi:hypothetical protein
MRIRIAATLGNRDSTTDKDERILNGWSEGSGKKGDPMMVEKRPGLTSRYTLASGQFPTSSFGQAIFVVNFPAAPGVSGTAPRLIGIRGDTLTSPVT